ncbi:iron-containing alcohol dehydrogenase [Paenibacillus xylaniclasticus]|uniref:iron-containing alcohol dehydrogenase n=1 Tax=Paenibacillus xylaniclasticus TaxID=588083 RepID=UPI0013DFB630|nr:iron-containing alcohol dehydrogenase [Paenibacillus xylaniclasticus]
MNLKFPEIRYGTVKHTAEHPVIISSKSASKYIFDKLDFLKSQIIYEPSELSRIDVGKYDTLYAIGGGAIIDQAKIISKERNMRLVIIPTIMATDACFTNVAAFRENGSVEYIDTGFADEVVIDIDYLLTVPFQYHLSSIGDILAIQSSSKDYMTVSPLTKQHLVRISLSLVKEVYACRDILLKRNSETLELLIDLLITKVQLGLTLQSPGLEEGTEHFFVYIIEKYLKQHYLHGDLVLAGILVSSVLQNWDKHESQELMYLISQIQKNPTFLADVNLEGVVEELLAYCSQNRSINSMLCNERYSKVIEIEKLSWIKEFISEK